MPYRPSTYARIRRKYHILMALAALTGASVSVVFHIFLARRLLQVQEILPPSFVGFAIVLTAIAAAIPTTIVYLFKRRWHRRYVAEHGYLF